MSVSVENIFWLFLALIIAYFCLSFLCLLRNWQNTFFRSLAANATTNLTSLGILGTFVGISAGLLEFDIQQINRSLPDLLEGLKIAFFSSIAGLSSALLFRIIRPMLPDTDVAEEDVGEKIASEIARLRRENKTNLDAILKALSDDGDSSVAGQIQRLRTDVSDLAKANDKGFKRMSKEFTDFSKHISETLSKALLDELTSVIHEFNEKITEQFGENFKQLNAAVGELVNWLDTYRKQMDGMREDFEEARQASVAISEAVATLPDNLAKLNVIMGVVQAQTTDLEERLKAFNDLKENALASFADISDKIEEMVKETGEATGMLVKSFGESRETQKQMLDGLQSSVNQTITDANESIQRAFAELRQSTETQLRAITTELGEQVLGASQELASQVKRLQDGSRQR
ncbi:MAG: hypothetical protein MJE68_02005 [Proteobacteria bacterium]|nr:hypothetical protein [Pseudomonadota bacterium]